jgi:myo-inositol catabolism protein IolC
MHQPLDERTPKLQLAKESGIGVSFAIGCSIWPHPAELWFVKTINHQEAIDLIEGKFKGVLSVW